MIHGVLPAVLAGVDEQSESFDAKRNDLQTGFRINNVVTTGEADFAFTLVGACVKCREVARADEPEEESTLP